MGGEMGRSNATPKVYRSGGSIMFNQFNSHNVDRCDVPLGTRDGRVTRAMFTASSMYNHYYGPWSARLQAQNRGSTRGGWVAKYRNTRQWLQIDLGTTSRVKRIATQARYDANQWVKSYTVSYSNNGVRFYPYKHGKRIKVIYSKLTRSASSLYFSLGTFSPRRSDIYVIARTS